MPNLQPKLDDLVAALNERRVRYERRPVPGPGNTEIIDTIANEPAQAAWEELTKECPVCGGLGDGPTSVGCNKTGRISQDIRAWPTSAVRGMLMGAMLAYDSRYSYITMWTQAPEALIAAFQVALEGGE